VTDESYGQIKNKISVTLFILKKMLLYCGDCDFEGLKVSQGKVHTIQVRWYIKRTFDDVFTQ